METETTAWWGRLKPETSTARSGPQIYAGFRHLQRNIMEYTIPSATTAPSTKDALRRVGGEDCRSSTRRWALQVGSSEKHIRAVPRSQMLKAKSDSWPRTSRPITGWRKNYVQAKRWEGTVGRPIVQAFAGSLEGFRARKGVMISTSNFSREALDYVTVTRIEKKIFRLVALSDARPSLNSRAVSPLASQPFPRQALPLAARPPPCGRRPPSAMVPLVPVPPPPAARGPRCSRLHSCLPWSDPVCDPGGLSPRPHG